MSTAAPSDAASNTSTKKAAAPSANSPPVSLSGESDTVQLTGATTDDIHISGGDGTGGPKPHVRGEERPILRVGTTHW
jgi:hypothetical protein